MKPGEFVGVKKSYSIECFDGEDWYKVNRTHPDFAAAVAALQSLIEPPSLDPRAGRVLAMREVDGHRIIPIGRDWRLHFYEEGRWDLERFRMGDGWCATDDCGPTLVKAAFEAGRRYERERGCAYVSDKPWTRQS